MTAIKELQPADSPTMLQRQRPQTSRGILFFDLEAIPDYERQELFDLESIPAPSKRGELDKLPLVADVLKQTLEKIKEDLRFFNPVDHYLDELDASEKAATKPRKGIFDLTVEIRRQDDDRNDLIAKQRKTMSVTPEMNRIVAMGWSSGGEVQSMVVGDYDPLNDATIDETAILNTFWSLAESHKQLCGFHILGFDLPTVFVRSILLGVKATRQFDTKPWGTDVIDLMAKRFPKSGAMRLKLLAKVMGLPIEADGIDGSQVEDLLASDPTKVGQYVRSDVQLRIGLYDLYRGMFC